MIAAAEEITRPVAARPRSTLPRGVAGAQPVLPDPRQQEHLVVHRQPEEDREHQDRDPARHRHRVVEAEQARRPSPTGRPRSSTPYAAAIDSRFITAAFTGTTTERNIIASSSTDTATTNPTTTQSRSASIPAMSENSGVCR